MMVAIRPDAIRVHGKTHTRVWIGLKNQSLHHEKRYQALLHPELIYNS
jgi:hypothetical protein